MTATLINPTTQQCRSKNPATCRYHGQPETTSLLTAEGMYQNYMQTRPQSNGTKTVIGQALQSNLKYEGEKPSWWQEYHKQTTEHHNAAPQPKQRMTLCS